tara:strand:+ start:429 stop:1163 length:735 start_codon:yes stop_codon:yes gene_type:complete
MIFKKKPKVKFWSSLKNLDKIVKPLPANEFYPSWFKYSKQSPVPQWQNIKSCIGFTDYFKMGYVIPLWCDLKISINELGHIKWETPHTDYKMDFHEPFQMQNLLPEHEKKKIACIIKTINPFHAEITKGWSLLQLPMTYWFEEDWTVASGIFPTSVWPELNQQIIIYKSFFDVKKTELYNGERSRVISKGTPIAQYMPIPNTFEYEVVEETKELKEKRETMSRVVGTSFERKIHKALKCPYVKR